MLRDTDLSYVPTDSPTWRLAARGAILLTQVGSGVHGVTVDDQDDRDELGITVEPPGYVVGLDRFEQFEWRTQPQGARSGPGDVDLTIYSLRKWARLAAQGNPSILVPLFVPDTDVVYASAHGVELRRHPELFLSRRAGYRFLGYMQSQREKLLGERGNVPKRPELIERYGFDTKFAYHMVRLGIQGVELLTEGRFTLPMAESDRTWLRELRRGEHTQAEALERATELEARLLDLVETADLPDRVDGDRLNRFLYDVYTDAWNDPDYRKWDAS